MVSIELSSTVEKKFMKVVKHSYNGDFQTAISALLKLHKKYGWKEQFRDDIDLIRSEVSRKGGIKAKDIDGAIKKYRENNGFSD